MLQKSKNRYQKVIIPEITNMPIVKRVIQTPSVNKSTQSKHILEPPTNPEQTCDEDDDADSTPEKHTVASMSATFSDKNLPQHLSA